MDMLICVTALLSKFTTRRGIAILTLSSLAFGWGCSPPLFDRVLFDMIFSELNLGVVASVQRFL